VAEDLEIAVLTATFDARDGAQDALFAILARYVVMTRRESGCRNVDLVTSVTHSGRVLVIEKWESAAAAQAHLDSRLMANMAAEVVPLLARRPDLDLYDTVSAHDLA
jgi:quinol monooxygenase YgiN